MSNQLNLARALPPLIAVGLYLILWFVVPDGLTYWVMVLGGAIVLLVAGASLFGLPGPTDAAFPGVLTPLAATAALAGVLATVPSSLPIQDLPVVGPIAAPGTPPPPSNIQRCDPGQPKGPLLNYAASLDFDRRQHHPRRWDSRRLSQLVDPSDPDGPTEAGPHSSIFPQRAAHRNTDLTLGRIVAEVFVDPNHVDNAGQAGYPNMGLPPGRSWIMVCGSNETGYTALIIPAGTDALRTQPVTAYLSSEPEVEAQAQFNEGVPPAGGGVPVPTGTVAAQGALDNGCISCKQWGWCSL